MLSSRIHALHWCYAVLHALTPTHQELAPNENYNNKSTKYINHKQKRTAREISACMQRGYSNRETKRQIELNVSLFILHNVFIDNIYSIKRN